MSLSSNNLGQTNHTFVFQPNARVKERHFVLPNGVWRLRITGTGFVPVDQQNINVNGNATKAINLTVCYYTLHTDRNRDGALDDAGALNQITPNAISFGPNGRGAIIPVNCNRDGNNAVVGRTDNQDRLINGNNDLGDDIARIEIRQTRFGPNVILPANWSLRLRMERTLNGDDPAQHHFRIFNGVVNNSAEIIGPETVQEATLTTQVVGNAMALGMEAVRFSGRGFGQGQGVLYLFVIQPEVSGLNNPAYLFADRIVAARWIGNHHRQTVSRLYVADANNARFRGDLNVPVLAENPAYGITIATPTTANQTNVPYLNVNAWGNFVAAGEVGRPAVGDDRWLRDTFVSGHSVWPGSANNAVKNRDVFMKTHRWRALQNWVYQTLISRDVGLYYPAAGSLDGINDGNSGGNIAVTPPVKKTRNNGTTYYHYGRIYYGDHTYSTVDASSQAFFRAQNMQAPIVLNTDWLAVGHVDEMMTFIPDNNPADPFKKWKLLVASPAKAYEILDQNENAHGNAKLLARPPQSPGNATNQYVGLDFGADADVSGDITDFTGNGQAPTEWYDHLNGTDESYTYDELRTWNVDGVEAVLNRNVALLQAAFDLVNNDIIRVPVIFVPEERIPGPAVFADLVDQTQLDDGDGFNVMPGCRGGFRCAALTGDMVNMFVGNTRLMVPKPFGPWVIDNTHANNGYDLFENYLAGQIAGLNNGQQCVFIDDWEEYHDQAGEIHCGTNELRRPFDGETAFNNARYANWWTAVDA